MPNVYLATYSSGNLAWTKTRQRLVDQALKTEWFNEVFSLDETFLDHDFAENYASVLNKGKGAGFWIWKPHIISKCLEMLNDGDILFFLDAGCTINAHAKDRFNDYLHILADGGIGSLAFQMPQVEKWWTTRQIFDHYSVNLSSSVATSGQLISGIFGLQKRRITGMLIREVLNTLRHDPLLFTDEYDKAGQIDSFMQNRHDQSVFSVARKLLGTDILPDETSFIVYGDDLSLKLPFWATRIKPSNPAFQVLLDHGQWGNQPMPSTDLIYSLSNINKALNVLGLGIGKIGDAGGAAHEQ